MIGWNKNIKAGVAWIAASFLVKKKVYTKEELEAVIRKNVKENFLKEPIYAPDHIRMTMIEQGYVIRSQNGKEYRLQAGFVSPQENESRRKKAIRDFSKQNKGKRVNCLFCPSEQTSNALMAHFLKEHDELTYWADFQKKYFKSSNFESAV